jgi:hypothetical protein
LRAIVYTLPSFAPAGPEYIGFPPYLLCSLSRSFARRPLRMHKPQRTTDESSRSPRRLAQTPLHTDATRLDRPRASLRTRRRRSFPPNRRRIWSPGAFHSLKLTAIRARKRCVIVCAGGNAKVAQEARAMLRRATGPHPVHVLPPARDQTYAFSGYPAGQADKKHGA